MDKRLEDMSVNELKAKLSEYNDLLEEFREEREMLLGQTGHHISSTGIVNRYEALERDTKKSITDIETLISARI